ncbi:hypothetical protein IL992_33400 [Microbispora sp. NEAU-D428]|uniref:hypothetical protein n=1 Tax=Microbispora sitophila TaxID=2771537 RepID=UPI0018662B5B|nr:hypothetical protein [Microbispora sitophila]MBE3014040.1 hypothetical protein [Microbispora sitophila]
MTERLPARRRPPDQADPVEDGGLPADPPEAGLRRLEQPPDSVIVNSVPPPDGIGSQAAPFGGDLSGVGDPP